MKLVKKPNGYYYCKVRGADGKQKEISTRVKSKSRAEEVVKESNIEALELAAQAQVLTSDAITRIVAGKKVTLSQALERWEERIKLKGRSKKTEYNSIICVSKWLLDMKLGYRAPAYVSLEHVSKWVNNPKSNIKASTRGTYLSAIKTFMEFCADEGWRVGNPAKGVDVSKDILSHAQKEKREVKLFSEADVSAIVAATDDVFWRFAASLSFDTGLRLGDICCLELDCFDGDQLTVWTDKRDKRVGPFTLSERTLRLLRDVCISSPKYLFPENRDIYLSKTRRALLSVQFKKICNKAGLAGHTFHGLRHTYASRTFVDEKESLIKRLQEELAELKVAENMGHSSTSTTRGYIHKS